MAQLIVNKLNKFVYDNKLMRTIAVRKALAALRNRRNRKRINSFPINISGDVVLK